MSIDLKHIGEYQGSRVIVLGYNKKEDNVLVVRPETLSREDQTWLSQIVESGYAQNQDNLIKSLSREHHSSGSDGFTYIINFGRPFKVSPYEIKLYNYEQAIKWFGNPSNHASKHDRRAPAPEPLKPPAAVDDIAPADPVPNVSMPPQVFPSLAPTNTVDPRQPVLNLTPSQEVVASPKVLEALEKATVALKNAAEKLEKTLDLDRRLKNLEKASREKKNSKEAA